LAIGAVQAGSFVFGPPGVVLKKAILQLRISGQHLHALSGRVADLRFGGIDHWAPWGNLNWDHVGARWPAGEDGSVRAHSASGPA